MGISHIVAAQNIDQAKQFIDRMKWDKNGNGKISYWEGELDINSASKEPAYDRHLLPIEALANHMTDPNTTVMYTDHWYNRDTVTITSIPRPKETPPLDTIKDRRFWEKIGYSFNTHGNAITVLAGLGGAGAIAQQAIMRNEWGFTYMSPTIKAAGRMALAFPTTYISAQVGKNGVKQLEKGNFTRGFTELEGATLLGIGSGALAGIKPVEKVAKTLAHPSVIGGLGLMPLTSYLAETGVRLIRGEGYGSAIANSTGLGEEETSKTPTVRKKVLGSDLLGLSGVSALASMELVTNGLTQQGYRIPEAFQKPLTKAISKGYLTVGAGLGVIGNSAYLLGYEGIKDLNQNGFYDYGAHAKILSSFALGLGGTELVGRGLQKFSNPTLQKLGDKLSRALTGGYYGLAGGASLDGAVILGLQTYKNMKEQKRSLLNPGFENTLFGLGTAALGITTADMLSRQFGSNKVWGMGTGITALGIGTALAVIQGVKDKDGFSMPVLKGLLSDE